MKSRTVIGEYSGIRGLGQSLALPSRGQAAHGFLRDVCDYAMYLGRQARLRTMATAAAYGFLQAKKVREPEYYLRLGIVLKKRGRLEAAAETFQRSFQLQPIKASFIEFVRLRGINSALSLIEVSRSVDVVYFEIDTLLEWGRHQKTLTGIQRVTVAILQQLLSRLRQNPKKYEFVFGSVGRDGFWRAEPADLQVLIDVFLGNSAAQQRINWAVQKIEERAVLARASMGQCYVTLSAMELETAHYFRLKEVGLELGMYIYDLIPLSHTQFIGFQKTDYFRLSAGDNFAIFDFALTISQFTALEIRRLQDDHRLRRMPVEAIPLAHPLPERETYRDTWRGAIARLRGRPFVLFVSTIEPRKNHPYLVNIWKRFIEEKLDPPDLVFVGRIGWLMDEFMEQLRAMNFLEGRIHLLNDLSDTELETLYRHCLFTTYPSLVEGWGLPVGESLAYGRPCVASSASSIPEVGGDLVDYVDPTDLSAGFEVYRRMIFDNEYRSTREQAIREDFVPRTWELVTDEFLSAISRFRGRKVDPDPRRPPLLQPGEIFAPGDLHHDFVVPPDYLSRPLRLIMLGHWAIAPGKCAWLRGDELSFRFRTELPLGTDIAVYMKLVGALDFGMQSVEVTVGKTFGPRYSENASVAGENVPHSRGASSDINIISVGADQPTLYSTAGAVEANGDVEINLRLATPWVRPADKTREVRLGLVSLCYAELADAGRRTSIVNQMAQEPTTSKRGVEIPIPSA